MGQKILCCFVLGIVTVVSWGYDCAQAEPQIDFTQLSFEELVEADAIALNVLGTHTHFAEEWMLGYQYMFMRMDGNRDGTDRVSSGEVLRDFPVTPTDMNMEMHMGEVMYAFTDNLTLMAMLPYIRLSMDHITRTGVRFTTTSEGIGDFRVKGIYTLYRNEFDRHRVLVSAGVSLPTGSIDKQDDTPVGPDQQLPYPMQLGSGTFDLLPGLTYLGQTDNWGWGGEALVTLRLGENGNDYTLGNRYHLAAWGSRKLTQWLSSSVRIAGQIWDNINGADPALNPAMVSTADPKRRGGKRVDLLLGIDLYVPRGKLKGLRMAVEGGVPLYQSLDGPQLETDWLVRLAGAWTF